MARSRGRSLEVDTKCCNDSNMDSSCFAASRASILAPVLRMCIAAATARASATPAMADAAPARVGAAPVIYLGDIAANNTHGAKIIKISDILDSFSFPSMSDNGYGALISKLCDECGACSGAPFAIYADQIGFFACGSDISEALRTARLMLKGISENTGAGAVDMGAKSIAGGIYKGRHIEAMQNEEFFHPALGDAAQTQPIAPPGRLDGKIALVTGAAQGFGKGIAWELAAEGAYVAVADLNFEGVDKCASELNRKYGAGRAISVAVNVTDEDSVEAMVRETVLAYGGLDLYISNAGVLIANALPDMAKKDFELVTSVNYTGYFLGVKYASAPMKIQRSVCKSYMADIIEINSKSGLEGSNKNFAYAGSKFGGIGLTQSFALELVEYGIKVNAICPGNFLDGPLWSDPAKGLFKQYLDTGKVPGAKTVGDVRRYYESRVPMKRGCTVKDVVKAILYLVEQEYETGQALPVTGGQVMLN